MDYRKQQPSRTPRILYKYRYFDPKDYHLDILRSSKLWFSSAQEFNDPFDSRLFYTFDNVSYKTKYKWAESVTLKEMPNLNKKQRDILIKQRLSKIDNDPEYIKEVQKNEINNNYNKFGVCCLAASYNDLLMWAHYSNKHEGFIIGIDSEKILKIQNQLASVNQLILLHKIEYSSKIPNINFYKSMLSPNWDCEMIKLLITKSIHWKYEKEFRLIYWGKIKTNLEIGPDAIKEIYLGCRIEDNNKNKIMKLAKNHSTPLSVYQAIIKSNKFKLKFEKIN